MSRPKRQKPSFRAITAMRKRLREFEGSERVTARMALTTWAIKRVYA